VYAEHPSTDLWCLAYFDGETKTSGVWLPGDLVPDVFFESCEIFSAWNCQFERDIHTNILVPRYGFPPIEQWHDTAVLARQFALPAGLGNCAKALSFPVDEQKDAEGNRLMLQMAKPRQVLGHDKFIWWEETIDDIKKNQKEKKKSRLERLIDYCLQDVRVEYQIYEYLREIKCKNPKFLS
jgi:DNA polymerase